MYRITPAEYIGPSGKSLLWAVTKADNNRKRKKRKTFSFRWHMFIAAKDDDDSVHPRSVGCGTGRRSHHPMRSEIAIRVFMCIGEGIEHRWWNRRNFSVGSTRLPCIHTSHSYPLPIKWASDCGQWFINQLFRSVSSGTTDVCRIKVYYFILCGGSVSVGFGRILTFLVCP